MPIINVKDLGEVKIAGETPTEEERQNMLREIERRSTEAQQLPAITAKEAIAGAKIGESIVDDLALRDTLEGFESLEAPVGREFFGDYEHPLQSEFVRPLTAGVSSSRARSPPLRLLLADPLRPNSSNSNSHGLTGREG